MFKEAASMFKGKGAFEVFAFFPQYLITTMQRTLKLVRTVLCIYYILQHHALAN
jgi:hypothetical protein